MPKAPGALTQAIGEMLEVTARTPQNLEWVGPKKELRKPNRNIFRDLAEENVYQPKICDAICRHQKQKRKKET